MGTLTVLLPDLARLTLSSDPMQQMHRRLGSSTLHLRSVGGESCQSLVAGLGWAGLGWAGLF